VNPQIRHRQAGEVVAEVGPLLLRIINGAVTTHASVDRLVALLDEMLDRWPVVGVLAVVEHGSPQPNPEMRLRVDDEMRRYGERIVVGYAFLGIGFWSTDARRFGEERAAALGVPVFVETQLEPVVASIVGELDGVDAAAAVVEVVEGLRSL
jgi:hypothetical protein